MAPGAEQFLGGLPVPVDPEAIEHELVRLWKPDLSTKDSPSVTRVCLSNLIVHLPDEPARDAASRLLPAIARRHPSRILVLAHRARGAGEPALSASIAALCHRPEPGATPVCCEQIVLEAPPGDEGQFPGAVLPLLVPDVPTTFVAIFPGGKSLVGSLSRVAERIVVDSRRDGGEVLASLSSAFGRPGIAVGDLAWEATLRWRRVLADLFDEPEVRAVGTSLRRLEAAYRPEEASGEPRAVGARGSGLAPAALLAGWLASRLGLDLASGEEGRREGRGSEVVLRPAAGGEPPAGEIASLRLVSDEGELAVTADPRGFSVGFETPRACVLPRRIPGRPEDDVALLGRALERVPDPEVFAGAALAALRLLGRDGAEGRKP